MAMASVIPDGTLDIEGQLELVREAFGEGWPEDDLWICVVGQHDMARRVFGRDRSGPLTAAIAASCAVPGYFSPVSIDGRAYVDGGVRSPTNVDVLVGRELDLAIIVSPMSGHGLGYFGLEAVVRRHAKRKLAGERAALEAAGVATVVIEPSADVLPVLGVDFMSDENVEAITHAAFLDTGAQLQRPGIRARLDPLSGRVGVAR
jgi:NTE family protein